MYIHTHMYQGFIQDSLLGGRGGGGGGGKCVCVSQNYNFDAILDIFKQSKDTVANHYFGYNYV